SEQHASRQACTLKIVQLLDADRATLFLVDSERGELWSKVAQHQGERPLEIRVPMDRGVAGHVARTGRILNVPDAYAEPIFQSERPGARVPPSGSFVQFRRLVLDRGHPTHGG